MRSDKERERFRRMPDGEIVKVYLRRCENCRCWFGTPWYQDEFCCPACKEAAKKRRWRRTR